jgi:hypothetical protein
MHKLLETFDQLIRSSEIRSSDCFSLLSLDLLFYHSFKAITYCLSQSNHIKQQ